MIKKLRLGSRGSKLALFQTGLVKETINKRFPDLEVEIIVIKTKGDKILDTALSKIGDKGLFTKELENSLLSNQIDAAVHSLKDMPSAVESDFCLSAVLKRADYRDALVSMNGKKLNEITPEDIIATSSLRRIAQLRYINPDYKISDIRGNIHTRLKKMNQGYCDAMILASAGLQRLQLDDYITEILEPDIMVPAVGQGAIAIETCSESEEVNNIFAAINHPETWNSIVAERAFMNRIEGGCQVPVGCYTNVNSDNISITGFIASLDGQEYFKESLEGTIQSAQDLGLNLAEKLLDRGGRKILSQIRS